MKLFFLSFLTVISLNYTISQGIDTTFFPNFEPYSTEPIINYGDDFAGAPWNDPCVLKVGNEYWMYASAVHGGVNHPNDTLAIYRFISNDGYQWELNPMNSVLKAKANSFYQGGVETPSVAFYKGEYHMYNTVYTQNISTEFKISHATSLDGLTWIMDTIPFLEPNPSSSWSNFIVGEPGILVKNDTLLVFFATVGNSSRLSIGLAKTIDGTTILDSMNIIDLPTNVYPLNEEYVGLSTPSPCLVGDTIYLFTDVAQMVLGNWSQVALHQFKSYGDLTKWYADVAPIHTLHDFAWTDGNYLSEIRSITPLLDNNKLRIWYAGNNLADIDVVTGDTTLHLNFVGNEMHANPDKWGIGTSEYLFTNVASNIELSSDFFDFTFDGKKGEVALKETSKSKLTIYNLEGKILLSKEFLGATSFEMENSGIIFLEVSNSTQTKTIKLFSK